MCSWTCAWRTHCDNAGLARRTHAALSLTPRLASRPRGTGLLAAAGKARHTAATAGAAPAVATAVSEGGSRPLTTTSSSSTAESARTSPSNPPQQQQQQEDQEEGGWVTSPAPTTHWINRVQIPEALAFPDVDISLRPFQQEVVAAIIKAWQQGNPGQMICLPTGTGKTIVFSAALRYLAQQKAAVCLQDAGKPPPSPQSPLAAGQTFSKPGDEAGETHPPYSLRALVLAHRVELLQQTVEKLHRVWPGVQVTLVNAERKDFSGQVGARCGAPTTLLVAAALGRLPPVTDRSLHLCAAAAPFVFGHHVYSTRSFGKRWMHAIHGPSDATRSFLLRLCLISVRVSCHGLLLCPSSPLPSPFPCPPPPSPHPHTYTHRWWWRQYRLPGVAPCS
jgi:hypothetical protein